MASEPEPTTESVAPAERSQTEVEIAALEPDELYRYAHRAHFVTGNPRAALAAWNRYLEVAPRGRFALEARYNRAIALARLGRNRAAISALRPFARGIHRGYRQQEARRLMRALEEREGTTEK